MAADVECRIEWRCVVVVGMRLRKCISGDCECWCEGVLFRLSGACFACCKGSV